MQSEVEFSPHPGAPSVYVTGDQRVRTCVFCMLFGVARELRDYGIVFVVAAGASGAGWLVYDILPE